MLTLNQIIDQITDLATAHSQIQESGVGTIAELQAKERNYPLLWVFHENTEINEGYLTSSIQIIVADRVITGEEGDDTEYSEQEILSDTQLILLDFINYFQQQHAQEYTVDKSALLAPFTETWNDRVAGNTAVMRLNQFYQHNKCWIPESGAVIPPSVDGLTLYDFCDATVFARLTDAQEACLVTQLCSAATTQVNGTNVGTVASGGNWNQSIHDSAGADVGTDANPSVISDSTNEVNGVDISDPTVAEGTHNQQVHDSSGSNVGTAANPSVIADSTVRNNATPTWSDTVEAEGTITLAQGKALDSDGSTTLLANYIPTTSGFMFTCTPGSTPTVAVTVDDSTPSYGDSITITVTPTGLTGSSFVFYTPNQDGTYNRTVQGSNTLAWTVDVVGSLTVYGGADDGSGSAYDIDGAAVTASWSFEEAIDLNGTTQYVVCDNINIIGGDKWMFSAWVEADSLAGDPILFSYDSFWFVQMRAADLRIRTNGVGVGKTYAQAFSTSTRYHILVQRTALGDNIDVYVNGVQRTTTVGTTGNDIDDTSNFDIGKYAGGSFYFNGQITDVVIERAYNASSSQITSYYNSGNGNHPSALGVTDPNTWLKFNNNTTNDGSIPYTFTAINAPTYVTF